MIKRTLLTALLALISTTTAIAQESTATTFWVYRSANIRSEPTTAGGRTTVIRTARQGEALSVVGAVRGEIPAGWEDNDGWYVVELDDGETGYVYSALVTVLRPRASSGSTGETYNEPLITGSDSFKARIRDALSLLRDRNPGAYSFVNKWLGRIMQGGYYCMVIKGTTTISMGMNCMRHGRTILAVALVHEACHVQRWKEGLVPGGLIGERACLGMEIEALRVVDPHHRDLPRAEHLHRNMDNPVCQGWKPTWNKRQCFALP